MEYSLSSDYDEEVDCLAREIENLKTRSMYQSINYYHKSHRLQTKAAKSLTTLIILMKRKLYHIFRQLSRCKPPATG